MRKNGKPLQKQKTETPLRPSIETRRACWVFMKRQFTPAYRIVLADAETQAIAPIELTEYELRTHIMSSNEDMSVARPEVPSTSTVVYKSYSSDEPFADNKTLGSCSRVSIQHTANQVLNQTWVKIGQRRKTKSECHAH